MEQKIDSKDTEVMHSFKNKKSPVKSVQFAILLLVAIGLGVGTGYAIAQYSSPTTGGKASILSKVGVSKGDIIGSDDTETFKDIAEGKLEKGGIEGEGQYHLVRPGGDSQNVYMTSSTVDLSKFVGKKIKVWGQTQTAQTAGWLMDVGRVEVL